MIKLNMLPAFAQTNSTYKVRTYFEYLTQLLVTQVLFCPQLPYLKYLNFSKFFIPVSITSILSSFCNFIFHVKRLVAEKKMCWVNTSPIVTFMQNVKFIWDWSVMNFPGKSMCINTFVVTATKSSVAMPVHISRPFPTGVKRNAFNKIPKSFYSLFFCKHVVFLFALISSSVAYSQSYIKGPALIEGVTSTVTAAGTTTLTAAAQTNNMFTGATTQTVVLPDATTLAVGRRFYITNRSTGTVTINFNGGSLAKSLKAGNQAVLILKTNGTAAGTWDVSGYSIDLTTDVAGVLPLLNGGTNKAITASSGSVPWIDTDSFELVSPGSTGQMFQSAGTASPAWTTATYPGTATGTGSILRADGTNWSATTATYPNTVTSPAVMVGNTNNIFTALAGTTANRLLRTNGSTVAFSQADLTTDVTGTLPFANGGLGISTGTSGGIPYFSSTSTVASSGLLAANQLVLGGGAGTTPATLGSLGTTTTVLHGNAAGAPTFGAVNLATEATGTLPVGNGGSGTPTTFTQGSAIFAGASGIYSQDNANYFWDATNHSLGLGNAAPGATYRLNVTGPQQITSTSSTSLVVGPNGATNPALQVDSSTASSVTGLLITGTATGSGTSLTAISSGTNEGITINSKGNGSVVLNNPSTTGIISLRTSSNARFAVSGANFNYTPSTLSTAATVRMSYVGAADTAMTTAVEAPNWYINLGQIRQHAQGAITTQRDFRFTPSTHSFATGASTVTDTMGMSIDGPPVGGTNATLTNTHSLYIGSAATANAGTSYGLTVNASSGATKNYAAQFQGGSVIVSNSGSALSTSATDGFLYIPTSAGAPAGTPTTQAGALPVEIDSTNNNIYYYSGGAWRLPTTTAVSTVTSQSTNYSAAINDVVLATAALTVTLPTAVGNAGKNIGIVNTSATAANVTINTTSAQTIGGRASGDIVLRRQNNYLTVTSDGANWLIRNKLEHQVVSGTNTQSLNGVSGSYQATSASVTLGIGEWDVTGQASINTGVGSVNSALTYLTGFYAADGANTTSAPTALAAGVIDGPTTINDLTGGGTVNPMPNQTATGNYITTPLKTRIIVTSGTQTVFFVPNVSYGTAGVENIWSYISATRVN